MKYESKSFESYLEAIEFSKSVKGYVDGPFLDDKLNREYIVFYKLKK